MEFKSWSTNTTDMFNAITSSIFGHPEGPTVNPAYQGEAIPIKHKHEWFRTGGMKPGQCRCISCGQWGQEGMAIDNPWKDLSVDDLLDICMAFDLSMSEARSIESFIKRKQNK